MEATFENSSATERAVFLAAGVAILNLLLLEQAYPLLCVPAVAVVLYGVLLERSLLFSPWFWASMFGLYSLNLMADWFQASNHHFMFMYLFLVLVLTLCHPVGERDGILIHNAKWLLMLLMGFAGLQKLLSPEYLDGSYFTYMITAGAFFKPLHRVLPEFQQTVADNQALLAGLIPKDPNLGASVSLAAPTRFMPQIGLFVAYSVLILELVFPFVWHFGGSSRFKHLLLLAFAYGTFLAVPETAFLAYVCVLGLIQCPKELPVVRKLYAGTIILFWSLMLLKFGLA